MHLYITSTNDKGHHNSRNHPLLFLGFPSCPDPIVHRCPDMTNLRYLPTNRSAVHTYVLVYLPTYLPMIEVVFNRVEDLVVIIELGHVT